MKIIGHRGASGTALENSRSAFREAIKHHVDMIELDVRLTADDRLVVTHDSVTNRLSEDKRTVRKETLAALQEIELKGGEHLISLDEALDIIDKTPVLIELKDPGSIDELLLVLARHPHTNFAVTSFRQEELRTVHRMLPDAPLYVTEHFAPIAIVSSARTLHAAGINLNKWLMNPITYYMARHYKLELNLYSVNSPRLARLLSLLYPGINVMTDHPERFTNR